MKKPEAQRDNIDVIFGLIGAAAISVGPDGIIDRMNAGAESLTGYNAADLAGKSLDTIFRFSKLPRSDDDDRPGELIQIQGKIAWEENEGELFTKSHGKVSVAGSAAPMTDSNGQNPGVIIVFSDNEVSLSGPGVKRHDIPEERLRESERTLKLFVEYAPASIAMFDRNMNYIAASRRYINDYRLKEENIAGRSHYEIFPEIPERWKEIHRRCLSGCIEKAEEDPFPRGDGTLDWVHWEIHPWYERPGEIGGIILFSEVITERKKTEEKIISTEKRYRHLIENAPDGIVLIDIAGNFKYASPSVERIFGYTYEDIPLYDSESLTHPDDLHMIHAELAKMIQDPSRIPTLQYRFRHKNGEWRWIESTFSNLLEVPDVKAIIINFRDIHERRLAEEELKKSQELLEEAQRIGHIGHIVWTRNTKTMFCSDELYRLLGLEPQKTKVTKELVGSMLDNEDKERLIRLESLFFEGLSEMDYEFQVNLPSGTRRWLHQHGNAVYGEDGKPLQLVATIQDITERKQAEITLRESEEKYRGLINSMNDTIWLIDYDLSVLDVNNTATSVLGYSREELLSMQIPDIDINLTQEKIQELASSMPEDKSQVFETAHRAKNGRVIPVEVSSSLVTYGGRTVILSIARDITERKKAESALKEGEEKFRKAFITSPDAININRVDDGIYVAINSGFTQITGYTEEDVMGKSSLDLQIWEDPEGRKRLVETLRKDGFAGNIDASFRMKNGEIRYGLMSASVIMLDNIPHILSITRDITERKLAEEKLRESENRFRSLYENATIGMYQTTPEGRIILSNPALVRMLGYSSFEELASRDLEKEGYEPGYKRSDFHAIMKRDGEVRSFEMAWTRRDGTTLFVRESARAIRDENGRILYYEGTVEDITERERAHKALAKSEEKYRLLFERVKNGYSLNEIITDHKGHPVDYMIAEVNIEFEKIFGRKREELIGLKGSELKPIGSRDWHNRLKIIGDAALGGKEGDFLYFQENLGRFYNVHIYSPGKNFFAAIYEDITEKKNMEGALKQVEDKYFALFNSQTDLTLLTEISDRGLPGRIIEANDQAIKITGYTKEELLMVTPADLCTNPIKGGEEVARQLLVGNTARIEQVIMCRNGSTFPAEILFYKIFTGDRTYAIIEAHDITSIKKAEKEAEKSKELMNALMTNVPLGVSIADADMNIIWHSQAGEQIPWLTIEDNIKTTFPKNPVYYSDTREPVPYDELPIVKAVVNDALVENMELSFVNGTGNTVDLNCNAVSVKDGSGKIIGGIMTYQDITSRKKKEEEISGLNKLLVKRTEELESSNRELEAFSYSVSHDLRAPLRHISGFTSLLSEKFEGSLDEEGEDFLRRICDSAVMMSTLIDDLLKLSRVTMSELKVELVNLSELFMSVCEEKVKEEPGRKVEIIVKENLYAECDASLMRICLTNLFENAWKFTARADKPVIQFGEEMINGRMCFFIRDNGVGFEMEHVDKLFRAFQRLHSSAEFDGTGIGLAIVKRAINKHSGSIWAESKKDNGAVFYFVLNS